MRRLGHSQHGRAHSRVGMWPTHRRARYLVATHERFRRAVHPIAAHSNSVVINNGGILPPCSAGKRKIRAPALHARHPPARSPKP